MKTRNVDARQTRQQRQTISRSAARCGGGEPGEQDVRLEQPKVSSGRFPSHGTGRGNRRGRPCFTDPTVLLMGRASRPSV